MLQFGALLCMLLPLHSIQPMLFHHRHRWLCSAAFKLFLLKTIVTMVAEVIVSYTKLTAILLFFVNVGLFAVVVRELPYYTAWMNCLQVRWHECPTTTTRGNTMCSPPLIGRHAASSHKYRVHADAHHSHALAQGLLPIVSLRAGSACAHIQQSYSCRSQPCRVCLCCSGDKHSILN